MKLKAKKNNIGLVNNITVKQCNDITKERKRKMDKMDSAD